jgi:hypothetical protein
MFIFAQLRHRPAPVCTECAVPTQQAYTLKGLEYENTGEVEKNGYAPLSF